MGFDEGSQSFGLKVTPSTAEQSRCFRMKSQHGAPNSGDTVLQDFGAPTSTPPNRTGQPKNKHRDSDLVETTSLHLSELQVRFFPAFFQLSKESDRFVNLPLFGAAGLTHKNPFTVPVPGYNKLVALSSSHNDLHQT